VLATVSSACLLGADGHPVAVEVHVSSGLPGFTVVGLPDAACREARDRVRAALLSSDLQWPLQRVTVNLAPSGLRKTGAGLDLAIAVALLAASGQLPVDSVEGFGFLGELGLDGSVRRTPGVLPLVDAIDVPTVVVPRESVHEAAVLGRHRVHGVRCLRDVVDALAGDAGWPPAPPPPDLPHEPPPPDLADVRGQSLACHALEVAAAGGHHLLLVGPPGAGKTTLAHRLPGLLPPLEGEEALATTRIHSAAGIGLPPSGLVHRPPLRAPHHGASPVAMIGGGTGALQPGEVSCAHNGVLFLDELGEYPVVVLEALRTPLEEGVVRVSRAQARVTFPARFLLVAAMNPCPCGGSGRPGGCRCGPAALARYRRRLSGPLLDRFDLCLELSPPDPSHLLHGPPGTSSADAARRVAAVRERARARGVGSNAGLSAARLDEVAPLDDDARSLLEDSVRRGRLTARGVRRVRTVALTLADLAGHEPPLGAGVVSSAMRLRSEPRLLAMEVSA
jgi:magnesium chelatase family protein